MTAERKHTGRRAVFIIIALAAVIAAAALLFSGGGLDTPEARAEYLSSLGWDVDPASETGKDVVLPEEFGGTIAQYNALQREQGFDLEPYAGREIQSWTYKLRSYPSGEENVTAQLYTYKGKAIAGDIHSNALGGFMHGLK